MVAFLGKKNALLTRRFRRIFKFQVFQTRADIFFILELSKGGDLEYYLQTVKPATEDERQPLFWVSELALAIDYIHGQRIVHRGMLFCLLYFSACVPLQRIKCYSYRVCFFSCNDRHQTRQYFDE